MTQTKVSARGFPTLHPNPSTAQNPFPALVSVAVNMLQGCLSRKVALSGRGDDRPGGSWAEASLVDLVVLLPDRAAGASGVCPDTQPEPRGSGWLHELTPRRTEAVGAGHRCELQIEALAMERAGDNESLTNLVDGIHAASLPAARLPTDHTRTPVRLQQLPLAGRP